MSALPLSKAENISNLLHMDDEYPAPPIVAANVLHATRDIRLTLRRAKALLKENGLLALNEVSKASLFTHVTFGLLDGWWLAEDEPLRIEGTPALSPRGWETVLAQEGFGAMSWPATFRSGPIASKTPKIPKSTQKIGKRRGPRHRNGTASASSSGT